MSPRKDIIICEAPGCQLPAVLDGRYCALHEIVEVNRSRAQKKAKKGDFTSQAIFFGLSWLGPAISQATQKVAQTVAQGPSRPPPPPPKSDPFDFLGLERECSVGDVRKRQRALAAIFHTDTGGGPASGARLAEINQAATECIKILEDK